MNQVGPARIDALRGPGWGRRDKHPCVAQYSLLDQAAFEFPLVFGIGNLTVKANEFCPL